MILKKSLVIFLMILAFCCSLETNAATYYTTGSGDWGTDAIWGTDTNGTGATWGSLTLVAGDIIYIDDDITLNNPGGIDIAVDVTVVVDAVLSIEKILRLTASSVIQVTSNGSVIATGGGSSTKINFGGGQAEWDSGDPDLFGPGILDENSNGALPIELIYFEATKVDDYASLSWATASEENFDYFEVQRATGLLEFETIAEIKGAGEDVFEIKEYVFTDERPLNGINYYRLMAIDLDGTFEYSPIQSLKFDLDSRFEVYPNPSKGQEFNLLVDDFDKMEAFAIYDNKGYLVHEGQITGFDDAYALPSLKAGLYLIKTIGKVESKQAKLVVP